MKSLSVSHVIRNTSVATFARLGTITVAFLLTPIVLNNLGGEKFGIYAVIGSLQAYFGVLDLGIGGALTRYMVYHAERGESKEVRGITTFGILFYVLLAALLFPPINWFAANGATLIGAPAAQAATVPTFIMIVFCLFIYTSIVGVLSARLAARHRLDLVAVSSMMGTLAFAALVLLFGQRYPTIEFLLICSTVQITIGLAGIYVFLRRYEKKILSNPRFLSWGRVRELFGFGFWSQINGISSLINLEADKIIIGRNLGIAEVTPYALANRLALLNRILPFQLLISLLPHITAQISRGVTDAELGAIYQRHSRSLMLVTLLVSGLVTGTVDPLLKVWLGQNVPGAATICVALIISYAVNNLTGVGVTIFRAEGKPQYETYYAVLSASLKVGLTIAFIQTYGLFGVILGTIIGSCTGSVFFIALFHRLKGLNWWETIGAWLLRLISATAVASLSAYLLLCWLMRMIGDGRFELAVAIGCAAVLYLIVFVLGATVFGYWDHADKAFFRKIINLFRRNNNND